MAGRKSVSFYSRRLDCFEAYHITEYGSKKGFRRLPFHCCALSLQPFEVPLCTADGHIFDLMLAKIVVCVDAVTTSGTGTLFRISRSMPTIL